MVELILGGSATRSECSFTLIQIWTFCSFDDIVKIKSLSKIANAVDFYTVAGLCEFKSVELNLEDGR